MKNRLPRKKKKALKQLQEMVRLHFSKLNIYSEMGNVIGKAESKPKKYGISLLTGYWSKPKFTPITEDDSFKIEFEGHKIPAHLAPYEWESMKKVREFCENDFKDSAKNIGLTPDSEPCSESSK